MSYKLLVIFGSDQVHKIFNREPFLEEELELNVKEFSFETEMEKNAFCLGINSAVGWMDCYILENNLNKALQI